MKYDINDGIATCRKINELVNPFGYCAGLTGSVLFRGESNDDIDIIIYPAKTELVSNDFTIVLKVLTKHFNCPAIYRTPFHLNDKKVIYKLKNESITIDLFFLK